MGVRCDVVRGGGRGEGGAVQVEPMKLMLKAPGTTLLKLQCDEPPSKFAFKFNLHRYTKVGVYRVLRRAGWLPAVWPGTCC